jgi:hypothetical protein
MAAADIVRVAFDDALGRIRLCCVSIHIYSEHSWSILKETWRRSSRKPCRAPRKNLRKNLEAVRNARPRRTPPGATQPAVCR